MSADEKKLALVENGDEVENVAETASIPVAGDPPGSANAAASRDTIESLQAKANKSDEYWDRLLRATADFENYKKRALREREEAVKYANEALLQKLLPVLDNFEMALAAAVKAESGTTDALRAGVKLIYTQLRNALTEAGLQEIDASNQPFNPNLH